MATKKVKIKTNAELAYECQKFLKRLSIDFKFLEDYIMWADGDDIFISSQLNNFFKITCKLKDPPENKFINWLRSNKNKYFKSSFKTEDFKNFKKVLKKDVRDFKETEHYFQVLAFKEEIYGDTNYDFCAAFVSEISHKYFVDLSKENSKSIEALESRKLEVFENEKKILELPQTELYGYEKGEFLLNLSNTEREFIKSAILQYENEISINQLFFNIVI